MGRLPAERTRRINEKIQLLYEAGLGCRKIAQVIELNSVAVYKRLQRMGLNQSPESRREVLKGVEAPFTAQPSDENLRKAALGLAIRWFLERGYTPSVPIEPTSYDLVVESDSGLLKVQVKTTTRRSKYGAWEVGVGHRPYCAEAPVNAGGRRKRIPYPKGAIDWFFVVTSDEDIYLIPQSQVKGKATLSLGHKYDNFRQGDGT